MVAGTDTVFVTDFVICLCCNFDLIDMTLTLTGLVLTETIRVVAPNGRECFWPPRVIIAGYGVGGKRCVTGPQAGSLCFDNLMIIINK